MPFTPLLRLSLLNLGLCSALASAEAASLDLSSLRLPPGFVVEVLSDQVPNARAMTLGERGTLFVGSMAAGKVYALTLQNGKAQRVRTIASGLTMPVGVAFKDGALYVSAVDKILRYDAIESRLDRPPKAVVVSAAFSKERHHGWKFIAFGPDDKLYVPVGAPCDSCDKDAEHFAVIKRMNADGSGLETYARGIRNTVGLTWHPDTKALWFTDNGRDMLGDELPSCELNVAASAGLHFGYPYCHQGDLLDAEFGKNKSCAAYVPPVVKLGPHVAPLGLRFYTGRAFPAEYRNNLFIAEHGSWNRSEKIGYRIKRVVLDHDGRALKHEVFAEGWLNDGKVWGRPVDVQPLADGSLLVSDDWAGAIYRIHYVGTKP